MHTTIACPSILKVLMPNSPIKGGIDFSAVRSFSDMPYTVANQQVDYAMRNGHVPVGFWHAPWGHHGKRCTAGARCSKPVASRRCAR
jgi:isoquinoline 1-oxidoreductase beta subunit